MSSDVPHSEENEALGSEFCSGYMDSMGRWNNGFYCPGQATEEQFCCGTPNNKYCCPHREQVVAEEYSSLPLFLGVVFGVVAAIILVTVMSCCFCSCCILYKKRQPRLNGGPLYRMHCSSAASGVANMYSFSNPNSLATTPLDSAVASSRLLLDLEPVVTHSMGSGDGRATMGRGHTFSRETRSTGMEVHMNDFGELTSTSGPQSPEPPPPYDSSGDLSTRNEQHRDTTVQVLSHGTCFSQQTFNPTGSTSITVRPTPCSVSQTSVTGTSPHEPQSTRIIPSTGTTDLVPAPRIGTTFNAVNAAESFSVSLPSECPTISGSVPRSAALLQGPSTSSLATIGLKGHDNLYHSTKF